MTQLPQRKPTRWRYHDYGKDGRYFVTICTKDRRKILSQIVGDGAPDVPCLRLTSYGKIVEKYILSTDNIKDVTVDKYVIMPNHIHMILTVSVDGTSRAPSPTRFNEIVSRTVAVLKRFVNRDVGENIFTTTLSEIKTTTPTYGSILIPIPKDGKKTVTTRRTDGFVYLCRERRPAHSADGGAGLYT